MNAYEAEERLWKQYREAYRHPPRDFARGFRPLGGFIADFGVVWYDRRLHVFHIDRRLGETECAWPGHEIFLGHASTADLVKWTVHDPVMLIRPGTWEGAHVGAPYLLDRDALQPAGQAPVPGIAWPGRFVMAYQGINEQGSQNLGLAFSDDLFHWQRSEHNPISPLAGSDWAHWRNDGTASCRDAHLNCRDGRLWLNFTACMRDGHTCIALTSSADLVNWSDHGPILCGRDQVSEHDATRGFDVVHHVESSALIRRDDHWLLFAVDGGGVSYWESERMERFDYGRGRLLWPNVGPAELIWASGSRWLMAACQWSDQYEVPGCVLRFGEVDWSEAVPQVSMITDEADIRPWMERIGHEL